MTGDGLGRERLYKGGVGVWIWIGTNEMMMATAMAMATARMCVRTLTLFNLKSACFGLFINIYMYIL